MHGEYDKVYVRINNESEKPISTQKGRYASVDIALETIVSIVFGGKKVWGDFASITQYETEWSKQHFMDAYEQSSCCAVSVFYKQLEHFAAVVKDDKERWILLDGYQKTFRIFKDKEETLRVMLEEHE